MEQDNKIVLFQEKKIRREWHNNEWYFSVIDVVEVLSESLSPRRYWSDLKRKLAKEGYNQLYEKIVQFEKKTGEKVVVSDNFLNQIGNSNTTDF